VSVGLVSGPVLRLGAPLETSSDDPPGEDLVVESRRIADALEAVARDMEARAAFADGVAVEILQMSAELARDPALAAAAAARLRDGSPTAHALTLAVEQYCEQLSALGGYMAERVSDLRDVRSRAVARLLGVPTPGIPAPGHPYILTARDLSPADTATLADGDVVGLLTEDGGPTSHTAILAKSLGLPAVVACPDASQLVDGTVVVLDGEAGTVEVEPSKARRSAVTEQSARLVEPSAGGPGRTRDGHPVQLLVNVGTVADAERAADVDAEGVGLFRTEFVYLGREDSPDVAEQAATYAQVFTAFGPRPVTVRTLDAGSDKPLPFLGLDAEENPALGVRGLRVATRHPLSLRDQLDALARAQQETRAEIKVMAPMVSTAEEAAGFVELARAHGLARVGVMIEVPAAALRAADVVQVVDFVSIGTNDLSQYAFAADRMAGALGHLLDPWQPALLDLVAIVCEAGRSSDTPVGVCGEAASDPLLAAALTGLGVDSLSMAPPAVGRVRDRLAELDLAQCQRMAAAARAADSAGAARRAVHELSGASS
jgi:phosphotransferase system enzyme I (PtsI)